MSEIATPLPDCGCCAAAQPRTPGSVENRPGAPSLRYRIGTAGTFLASMQHAAGASPVLRRLHSRRPDEPSAALIEAWACTLDVLTFYTERIANEGYLRTATEARSLVELARAVGYERGPGRASATWLAFTLEDAAGSSPLVPVPVGTRVASVPGPGEVPLTFETTAGIDARPEWNALRAATTAPEQVAVGDTSVHLAGTATNLRPGDRLLIVGREDSIASGTWALRTLRTVRALPAAGITAVGWDEPLVAPLPAPGEARVHALRQRAAVFGATAPDWRTLPPEVRAVFRASVTGSTASTPEGPDDWPGYTVVPVGAAANTVDLDGAYPRVVPGGWLVLARPATAATTAQRRLYRITAAVEGARADFAVSSRTTRVVLAAGPDVAATFGTAVRTTVVHAESEQLALAPVPRADPVYGRDIDLAVAVPTLSPGHLVVVSGLAPRLQIAEDATGLHLTRSSGGTLSLLAGESLSVTGPPAATGSGLRWPVRRDSGDTGLVLAPAAQLVGVAAVGGPVHSELAQIAAPLESAGVGQTGGPAEGTAGPGGAGTTTTLRLAADLVGCYDRASLRVTANVAPATHGETRAEVLGSGDGGVAFQRFALRQAPLTYVEGASTLQVRVDGVRWEQVSSLLAAGPSDRVYLVRINADGAVSVEFGDGVTGARPGSGVENVTATYRVGTGVAGRLPAGRLTLPMTRPLGLRSVTNPLPTGLAADPDPPHLLRRNASRIARAVERVVSLADYEEFARSTPGFAKALAGWAWEQEHRVMHLTVAGADGQPVDEPALIALSAALARAGIPRQRCTVHVAPIDTFDADLTVVLDPAHRAADVQARVRAALLDAFGFDARELGQPVSAGEVMAVVQRVTGVIAVTTSRIVATPAADPSAAAIPLGHTGGAIGPGQIARMLIINPNGVKVTTT